MGNTETKGMTPEERRSYYCSIREGAESRKITYLQACAEKGVNYGAFSQYFHRLKKSGEEGKMPTARILRSPGERSGGEVTVSVVLNGKEVEVSSDARSLREVLEAVRDV